MSSVSWCELGDQTGIMHISSSLSGQKKQREQTVVNGILATRVTEHERFEKMLQEVGKLTDGLFNERMKDRFRYHEPFEVFLSESHAASVEETLDQLIFGQSKDSVIAAAAVAADVFLPTPKECMFLCAAVRLRCIGLLWGLFIDSERTPLEKEPASYENTQPTIPNWISGGKTDSLALQNLIESFPSRSSSFIRDFWQLECSWSFAERSILSSILNSYLPTTKERDIPLVVDGIRVRELAYLLRVATVCTLGPNVCPLEVRLRLRPDSEFDLPKAHLSPVKWITKTIFDHGRNLVEFRAIIPSIQRITDPRKGSSLPIAQLDYAPTLEYLGAVIQEVLDTVSGYLEGCRNTCIRTVKISSFHEAPDNIREAEAFLPDHWALPLAAALNAADVAGMTALVLRSFCKYGFGSSAVSFREQVAQVCENAEQMHPFNSLIRQFVRQVLDGFPWDEEPDRTQIVEFQTFLDDYLVARADAGDRVSREALNQNVLLDTHRRELDYVVTYGYGRSTFSTLIAGRFRGTVLMVEADPKVRGPWVNQEEKRIREVLTNAGISHRPVSLFALNGILGQARAEGKTFAFLTGAGCALRKRREKDQFLCPVGTWQVAAAANANGGRTIAIVESEKVVSGLQDNEEIEDTMKQVALDTTSRPWIQVDLLVLGTDIKFAVIA